MSIPPPPTEADARAALIKQNEALEEELKQATKDHHESLMKAEKQKERTFYCTPGAKVTRDLDLMNMDVTWTRPLHEKPFLHRVSCTLEEEDYSIWVKQMDMDKSIFEAVGNVMAALVWVERPTCQIVTLDSEEGQRLKALLTKHGSKVSLFDSFFIMGHVDSSQRFKEYSKFGKAKSSSGFDAETREIFKDVGKLIFLDVLLANGDRFPNPALFGSIKGELSGRLEANLDNILIRKMRVVGIDQAVNVNLVKRIGPSYYKNAKAFIQSVVRGESYGGEEMGNQSFMAFARSLIKEGHVQGLDIGVQGEVELQRGFVEALYSVAHLPEGLVETANRAVDYVCRDSVDDSKKDTAKGVLQAHFEGMWGAVWSALKNVSTKKCPGVKRAEICAVNPVEKEKDPALRAVMKSPRSRHRIVLDVDDSSSVATLTQESALGVPTGTGKEKTRREHLESLAESDDSGACYELAKLLEDEGFSERAKATSYMRRAADLGHAQAQLEVGLCLELGRGDTVVDEDGAKRFYRLAAEQGNAESMYRLFLLNPNDTEKLEEAANAGYALAQYDFGQYLEKERNFSQAALFYEKSSAHDFSPALKALGRLFLLGKGVEQDYDKGFTLLEKAGSL